MVILRDMTESDIEDYVRWFTESDPACDWGNWDSPWETEATTAEAERAAWTAYFESVCALPPDAPRWKFEIEADGEHIGWVSCYTDLGYLENPEGIPAIGIDISERRHRRRGWGGEALRLFMDYLERQGHHAFYTQTWSGNLPMLHLAEKLGFTEHTRAKALREVNNQKYDAVTLILKR